MQADTKYGNYWDSQAVAQLNILPLLEHDTKSIIILQERLAQLQAGRIQARNHLSVEKKLQELDPLLRLRWEFEHPDGGGMWAIDRFVPLYGYHFCLFYWSHSLGTGQAIKAILEDGDMQRADYLTRKKKYQEYALLRNDKLRQEIALAAVDSMTRAQLEQMRQVETALVTGEKIRPFGRDAEILNKMYANTRKLDALLHDKAPDSVIESVIGEQIKILPTDPDVGLGIR